MNFERQPRTPVIVVGLGYGDEAKGATVDFLAHTLPDTTSVIRWSGGAQAAHNVVHGPRHHTFRQFGSGSLLDVPTILRAPMMVEPLMLATEAEKLESLGVHDALGLITADARALVTTPIHQAMNRAREAARGASRHGSCGIGIGETVAYGLAAGAGARAGDVVGNFTVPADIVAGAVAPRLDTLRDRAATVRALDALMRYAEPLIAGVEIPDFTLRTVEEMADALCNVASHLRISDDVDEVLAKALDSGTVVFEGSQGVLLDEWMGFHPHTTWATTTPVSLRAELTAAGHRPYVLGLTRTYSTRHGAGPMPTEDAAVNVPEPHNGDELYQGSWRQGHLDLPALAYAAAACGGVDGVGVSHLDAVPEIGLPVATAWKVGADSRERPLSADGPQSLESAAARADIAFAATPEYRERPAQSDMLLALIAQAAGAPVVITADGPARLDRRLT